MSCLLNVVGEILVVCGRLHGLIVADFSERGFVATGRGIV